MKRIMFVGPSGIGKTTLAKFIETKYGRAQGKGLHRLDLVAGVVVHRHAQDRARVVVENEACDLLPVSYTHLDVYKRQIKPNTIVFFNPDSIIRTVKCSSNAAAYLLAFSKSFVNEIQIDLSKMCIRDSDLTFGRTRVGVRLAVLAEKLLLFLSC